MRIVRVLLPMIACGSLVSGCHLVPSDDVRVFMTDLRPRPGPTPDEAALTDEIRARSAVPDFEFDARFDTGEPPFPKVFSHVVRLVAGE